MKQLDPKAVWFFFLRNTLGFIVFSFVWTAATIGAILIANPDDRGDTAVGAIFWWVIMILIFIGSFIWAKLSYHFYKYELTDAGFRKELGVITKKYVTIPYDRIQNVDIYRGILSRILGLSDLNIQTAGASGQVSRSEGRLPALSREVAEQLRDELIQRAGKSRKGL